MRVSVKQGLKAKRGSTVFDNQILMEITEKLGCENELFGIG